MAMTGASWPAVCTKSLERGARLDLKDAFVLKEKLAGLERARVLAVAKVIFLIVQVQSACLQVTLKTLPRARRTQHLFCGRPLSRVMDQQCLWRML